jgi:ABC-type amino acid transport system permease subunit
MNCPVCFNASAADETVRTSLNLGILVLMGVTGVVLAGFLRFIVSIARLSKADLKVRLCDHRAQSVDVEAGLQARLPV